MQISRITSSQAGPIAPNDAAGLAAATATLNDPQGGLAQKLQAYQGLASRWRTAGLAERATLVPALTESPFAQKVQSTLNAFTRAAWAGADAVPPAPQAQALKAFDNLSDDDRQIVSAMQADSSGARAFASAADYRASLQAELDAARPATARVEDKVTLSDAAQAHLTGGTAPEANASSDTEPSAHPEVAAAISAYARAGG